jgi:hypothetical protein
MKPGAILLTAVLGTSILCGLALMFDPGIAKASLERKRTDARGRFIREQVSIDEDVSSCVRNENPWRCFVAFADEDRMHPVPFGASRTQRMAAIAPARDVLAFCLEWRKVDCADLMFGKGWSRAELIQGMDGTTAPPNPSFRESFE